MSTKTSQRDIVLEAAPSRTAVPFASSLEHLLAEIGRVELLVRAQLIKVGQEGTRQAGGAGDDLAGLVISEQEVADLLSPPVGFAAICRDRRSVGTAGVDSQGGQRARLCAAKKAFAREFG